MREGSCVRVNELATVQAVWEVIDFEWMDSSLILRTIGLRICASERGRET